MKYSQSLMWYENVRWDEKNCFVDCLVDVTQCELGEGYFLVEEAGQRKIIKDPTNDDLNLQKIEIIGMARKWDIDYEF